MINNTQPGTLQKMWIQRSSRRKRIYVRHCGSGAMISPLSYGEHCLRGKTKIHVCYELIGYCGLPKGTACRSGFCTSILCLFWWVISIYNSSNQKHFFATSMVQTTSGHAWVTTVRSYQLTKIWTPRGEISEGCICNLKYINECCSIFCLIKLHEICNVTKTIFHTAQCGCLIWKRIFVYCFMTVPRNIRELNIVGCPATHRLSNHRNMTIDLPRRYSYRYFETAYQYAFLQIHFF